MLIRLTMATPHGSHILLMLNAGVQDVSATAIVCESAPQEWLSLGGVFTMCSLGDPPWLAHPISIIEEPSKKTTHQT